MMVVVHFWLCALMHRLLLMHRALLCKMMQTFLDRVQHRLLVMSLVRMHLSRPQLGCLHLIPSWWTSLVLLDTLLMTRSLASLHMQNY